MVMSLRRHKDSRRNELSNFCVQQHKWIESAKPTALNQRSYKIVSVLQGPTDLVEPTASIYNAVHSPSNHSVVIKVIDLESEESLEFINHEINTICKLRNSNILPLLTSFVCENHLWYVMASAEYGSVDIWSKPSGLPELAIAFIVKDVLSALSYLHKRGFIHRAVCGSHILINSLGNCMLTGLKYSTTVLQDGRWQTSIYQYPKNAIKLLNYLAPEILEQNLLGYNSKSDIYSVGIVCCELANGCIPFEDIALSEMLLDKLTRNFPRPLDSTCEEIRNFPCEDLLPEVKEKYETYKTRTFSSSFHKFTIELCLNFDRFARPTAADLLSHSFIKQTKKSHRTLLELLSGTKANKTIESNMSAVGHKQNNPVEIEPNNETPLNIDWNF